MKTQVKVQYPTVEEHQIPITSAYERLVYRANSRTVRTSVNQARTIYVRVLTKTPTQPFDAEVMCVAQTGMTPSAYQSKFKKAWNE